LLQAQSGSASATIRGEIVSLRGSDLVVASWSGDTKLTVDDKTTIRAEVVIQFSEITLGMYLGTTATKQKDGHFLASEVHVSPTISAELARGIGRSVRIHRAARP